MVQQLIGPLILFLALCTSAPAGWRVHYIPAHQSGDYVSPEKVTPPSAAEAIIVLVEHLMQDCLV